MKKEICIKGIIAGILISLGGFAYLSVDNKYVGALLFCLALSCIVIRGDYLYTGRVCYLPNNFSATYAIELLIGIVSNFIGTFVCGVLLHFVNNDTTSKAIEMCTTKLDSNTLLQIFIKAIFCGILIFLSVDLYKSHKTLIPLLLCIPAFILSGFEHSIADMFYFSIAGMINLQSVVFIVVVIIGNLFGGIIINTLSIFIKERK